MNIESMVHYAALENPAGLSEFLSNYGVGICHLDMATHACKSIFEKHGDEAAELFLNMAHPDAPMFERLHGDECKPEKAKEIGISYTVTLKELVGWALGFMLLYVVFKKT